MQEAYRNLESKRKLALAVYFLGLALELCGVVLLFARRSAAGLAVAFAGLLLWAAASIAGKRSYQAGCARARAEYALGIRHIQILDRKTAAARALPVRLLVPASQAADRPLLLHPLRGEINDLPLLLTEVSLPYHDPQQHERRYLVGTLASFDMPQCRGQLLVLCNHPFGGAFRAGDYAGYRLSDTQGHPFFALSAAEDTLTEAQAAALDAFCAGEEKKAVFITEPGRVTAFFPGRFYSGSGTLSAPLSRPALQACPLPGWERLPALARVLGM